MEVHLPVEEEPIIVEIDLPMEDTSDYYKPAQLSNSLTEEYVLQAPQAPQERDRWLRAAESIRIDAWFEGTSEANRGTIFIDGSAYRSGENITRELMSDTYPFKFIGVESGQVILRALKREGSNSSEAAN